MLVREILVKGSSVHSSRLSSLARACVERGIFFHGHTWSCFHRGFLCFQLFSDHSPSFSGCTDIVDGRTISRLRTEPPTQAFDRRLTSRFRLYMDLYTIVGAGPMLNRRARVSL